MNPYLASSQHIDWRHRDVAQRAANLAEGCSSEEALAKNCFEFVRDFIKHSWDFKLNPVTCRVSDVLRHGTGYCYAKSHLLAALLSIPGAIRPASMRRFRHRLNVWRSRISPKEKRYSRRSGRNPCRSLSRL